jgi:hypothetical protein
MTDGLLVAAAFLALPVILPAVLGLVFDRARAHGPRSEIVLRADKARARATLAYYNEVHDSHSG